MKPCKHDFKYKPGLKLPWLKVGGKTNLGKPYQCVKCGAMQFRGEKK